VEKLIECSLCGEVLGKAVVEDQTSYFNANQETNKEGILRGNLLWKHTSS